MKTIGRYEICGLLGKGGMGKVYKVKQPVTGRIVALKNLDPHPVLTDILGFEQLKKLFIAEASTMANLRHPHIVEVLDFDEADDTPFFVMSYYCNNLGIMIGETYRTDDPSRIIRIDKAVHYTRQILEGLARLHYAGIIHRDIKPFNILITEHDVAKITDFGLSKLRGENYEGPANLKVGSPFYAAPEQEENPDAVDASADTYAVGVMFYRMLAGELPRDHLQKASDFNPDLDEKWDRFFHRAIHPDVEKRFSDAKSMIQSLIGLYTEWKDRKDKTCELLPSGEDVPSPAPAAPGKPRRKAVKVTSNDAMETFRLDDLWRPKNYAEHDFVPVGEYTVKDRNTNLIWETSGSDYPLTWETAYEYIRYLNGTQFSDRCNWRLPTIDELITLLTRTPFGEDFCMEPVFDRTQKWLWSCDRRSYTSAWYVSVEMGFVYWQDFTCYNYVRAVSKD